MCNYIYCYRYEGDEPNWENIQEAVPSPVNMFSCTQRNAIPTAWTSRVVKISVGSASEKHFVYSIVVKCGTTFLLFHYLFTLSNLYLLLVGDQKGEK